MPLLWPAQRFVVVEQDTFGRSIEIFVLSAPQRPHEGGKASHAEQQGNWNQIEEIRHLPASTARAGGTSEKQATTLRSRVRLPRRKALQITTIDDADMAKAAMSGVT